MLVRAPVHVSRDGDWGRGAALGAVIADAQSGQVSARRGMNLEYVLSRDIEGSLDAAVTVEVAFELVMRSIDIVICGSGPDVVPVARLATSLGWGVTVVDPRPVVAAVVLAAGASTRLGTAKQLVEFRGLPLVRRAAASAIAAAANPVIVVLLDLAGVHLELNERWRDGLASSLVAGVSAATRLDARCDGVLIIAADQPLVSDVALRVLMDAFRAGARLVAAGYSGTIGVPAIVGRERFESLLELGGDAGAGSWLRGRIDEVRSVPMPNAEMDIDGAEDVARLATLA